MSRAIGFARARLSQRAGILLKTAAITAFVWVSGPPPTLAQSLELALAEDPARAGALPRRGPETGLPIPRFVSLKSEQVNARRGPSLSHRVDWVFVRRGLPVEVVAEHGNWRKVRDQDGASGWVHHSLIRGARSVIVTAAEAPLLSEPAATGRTVAMAERGVLAWVQECGPAWCEIEADGHEGWTLKTALWGVRADELID